MGLSTIALALLVAADPAPAPAPARTALPRSSIAAVVAQRGALGLDDAVVKLLEERDADLQKKLAGLRDLGKKPVEPPGATTGRREGPAGGGPPDASAGRPRGGGGRHGSGREAGSQPPHGNAAVELQQQLDDADTAAWLAAEELLPAAQREPARAVAERYREALADQRDAARKAR